jgi:hypothetical protein
MPPKNVKKITLKFVDNNMTMQYPSKRSE